LKNFQYTDRENHRIDGIRHILAYAGSLTALVGFGKIF
jgi:hypothetical protein